MSTINAAAVARPPLTEAELRDIVGRIVARFNPQRIFVFGSYARGNWREESDLDLMVEMETDLGPQARRAAIRETLWPPPCAIDLLVYTPTEVEERRTSLASIVPAILDEGRIIYARPGQQV
jgi:predicted nucleotidyltransferase